MFCICNKWSLSEFAVAKAKSEEAFTMIQHRITMFCTQTRLVLLNIITFETDIFVRILVLIYIGINSEYISTVYDAMDAKGKYRMNNFGTWKFLTVLRTLSQ